VLPYPLSVWLEGAGLSIGMLFFYVMSLALLWNVGGERKSQPVASMQAHAAK
jgi:hypothetical protein